MRDHRLIFENEKGDLYIKNEFGRHYIKYFAYDNGRIYRPDGLGDPLLFLEESATIRDFHTPFAVYTFLTREVHPVQSFEIFNSSEYGERILKDDIIKLTTYEFKEKYKDIIQFNYECDLCGNKGEDGICKECQEEITY